MNSRRGLLLLSLLCLCTLCLGLALGCSKATPVAPSGTTIALSASPGRISSPSGTSTITAVLVKSNGQPANRGTQVRFDTNLGTIDTLVETDSSGVAKATLRGDGRVGMATVHASTGSITPVALMVQIGTAAGSVTVQANPSVIDASGGTISLLALVRDDSGQPLTGVQVNFQTDLGALTSGGGPLTTDANGQVTDKLKVTASDLASNITMFMVKANVASGGATLTSGTATIQVHRSGAGSLTLQASPSSIKETGGTLQLIALVRNDQGLPLVGSNVNFSSQIGTLGSGGGFVKSDSSGQATDTLSVTAADISALSGNSFQVMAQAAGTSGALMTQTFTVSIARAPVADFSFTIGSGTRMVSFNDNSSPKATKWLWDFGDGQTSTAQNPVHTFPASPNSFFVTLTATNAVGSGTTTKVVTFQQ